MGVETSEMPRPRMHEVPFLLLYNFMVCCLGKGAEKPKPWSRILIRSL
jgi:hypothetical protein